MKYFKLPDLGEGLPEAEIVEWHVKAGDEVEVDQVLASMETAKAIVDVPSPLKGKIAKLFGDVGDVIHTGSPLVGFEGEEEDAGTVVGKVDTHGAVASGEDSFVAGNSVAPVVGSRIQALPATRLLAKKLGVDIEELKGSGHGGVVTDADVQKAFEADDSLSKNEIIKGARRAMTDAMRHAFETVVPVTLADDADVSNWEPGQDPTVRLIKAMSDACAAEPALNAHFNADTYSRRLFDKVDLGIAVDSPHGLYVPVLRDIGSRDAKSLREGLDKMIKDVRDRRVPQEELKGATITLSNFGAIAGRYANPIITPPQVAIVGAGRSYETAVLKEGQLVAKKMLPLSVTMDHQACTGGEAARFLKALKASLEKPSL
ncbi:dihydrolipoamide acetyltransferase family protein [Gallaecimonas kandeliae]|uniref:dihydrolipoamide acetyltransferase family protein n=1 Tax=Gallaecimonas kandeliae TaxID=3029055 RepID=UPI002646FDAE|nr:dihydrolipoamide acetyltransferase family protein [Gallaecimonas kandeliae]WKE67201.1 dihydrolipoamide acetyltransferase family protein [Gallaecimonas kandeliae]